MIGKDYICGMKCLARHIITLLYSHDCVLVSGLGGFLAYSVSATYDNETHVWLSPSRTLGFNACLRLNDGLLAESYMQAYHISYNEANERIEAAVGKLYDVLAEQGRAELPDLGVFTRNARGELVFTSWKETLLTPSMYGLENLSILPVPIVSGTDKPSRHFVFRPGWVYSGVAAMLFLLFSFAFTLPLSKSPYPAFQPTMASLSILAGQPVMVYDSIISPERQVGKSFEPRVIKEEKVGPNGEVLSVTEEQMTEAKSIPQPLQQTQPLQQAQPRQQGKNGARTPYHIIYGSYATAEPARAELQEMRQKGFPTAITLQGNGRYRTAICHFSTKEAADSMLNQLRKEDAQHFATAWILNEDLL